MRGYVQDGYDTLAQRRRIRMKLIRFSQKGVFPYSWLDDYDKLKATQLPPIEEFYNDLCEKGLKQAPLQTG